MPSNPITPQEQYDILINRSLTPRDGSTTETYMAAAYILMPPATVDGPVKWRLFDAAYIQTGIIDPNRLGTGSTGAGNLYLADDGTWKLIGGGGGGGDMYKCFHPDTELLTLNGWKKITEISFDDEVATLNQETKQLEYQVPNHIFKYEYDGELIGRETKQLSYLVTPNHRMYVRKWYGGQRGLVWSENFYWEKADEVSEKIRSFPITAKWTGVKTETNPFGIDDDLFLEFLGWFLSEGCVVDTKIYVTQTKSKTIAECSRVMVDMARSLGRTLSHNQNAHFNFRHSELAEFLSQFGKHAHNKFIPAFVKNLPAEKLILFYNAYYKGDGHLDGNNITTVSKRMADDLQEVILKLGGYATIIKCPPTITSYGVRDFYRLNCNFNNLQGSTAKKDNYKVKYKGFVHCIEVDNATLYTRFNGKPVFLGNSTYDIDNSGIVDKAEALTTLGRNSTGATLYEGTIVRIEGSTGNRPNFVKAQANNDANSAQTFGVVMADIANNSDGYVLVQGTLHDLDTRTGAGGATNPFTDVTLADGDLLFLHPTIAGYVTNIKPSAPQHLVYVGVVTRTSPTNGTIVYRIQNGYELYELHDVAPTPYINNGVLYRDTTTNLWKSATIDTILGGTPLLTIPTLAQVTTAGNTTTNAITVGGLTVATNLIYTDTINGRVGINTASPLFPLDVLGTAKFASTTSGIIIRDWTAFNTYRAIYKASETPSDLNYLIAMDSDVLINSRGSGTDIRFNGAIRARFGNAFSLRVIGSGTTSATVGFEAANSSSTPLFQVRDNGNVLIGTTTDAGYKLDVNGTARVQSSFTGSVLKIDGTGAATGFEINSQLDNDLRPSYMVFSRGGTQKYIVGHSYGRSGFFISNGTDTVTYLNINLAGNVLVGTTTDSNAKFVVAGSITAASAIARGVYFNNTLVAAANNDVLVGLDINPTFTNGAFTGVTNLAARIQGNTEISRSGADTQLTVARGSGASFTIQAKANSTSQSEGVNLYWTANTWLKFVQGSSVVANFSNVGNLLVGTSTDAGYKLDVNGTLRTTSTIRVGSTFNGTLATLADFRGAGDVDFVQISRETDTNRGVKIYASGMIIASSVDTSGAAYSFLNNISGSAPSGSRLFFNITGGWAPTSGTASWDQVRLNPTINTTGTYSGIVRGIYYDPTLTSLTGTTHRAIETTSGDVIFNTKTATTNTGYTTMAIGGSDGVYFQMYVGPSPTTQTLRGQLWAVGNNLLLNNPGAGYLGLFTTLYSGITIWPTTGNVYVGASPTTDAGYKLDVAGTARVKTNDTSTPLNVLHSGAVGIQVEANANGYRLRLASSSTVASITTPDSYLSINSGGQLVVIGSTSTYNSAQVAIDSTTRGFLQPRMTNAQALAITTPATGLQVYDTTNNKNLLYNGTAWQNIATESWVSAQGYLTSQPWVVSGSNIYYSTGSVGIGTVPSYPFHISSAAAANIFGTVQSTSASGTAAWVAFNDQTDNVVYRVFGSGASGTQMGIALARTASLIANLGGSGKFLIGTYSGTDLVFGTSDTARMRLVDSTGNFLVGTMTDLGNKLEVSGTINATDYKVGNVPGWNGMINIPTMPPIMITVTNGIITNVM